MGKIVGGYYVHKSKQLNNADILNFYPEITPEGKRDVILLPTPSVQLFTDCSDKSTGLFRGSHKVITTSNNGAKYERYFVLYGGQLLEILPNESSILIANISALNTRVSFADNGEFLVFVDGNEMYIMDLNTNNIQNPILPFSNPTKVISIGGRFICINSDNTVDVYVNYSKIYWSDILDPSTWNGLNWLQTDKGELLINIKDVGDDLIVFTPNSNYQYRSTFNEFEPFSKISASTGTIGCGAVESVVKIGEQVFFLGSSDYGNNSIYMVSSGQLERISDHSIESLIGDTGNTSDAYGCAYQYQGHVFYILTFTAGNKTLVYDLSTGMFHRRSSRDPKLNKHNKWQIANITLAFGKLLACSEKGQCVCYLDHNNYKDFDSETKEIVPIVTERTTNIYNNNQQMITYHSFELDMQVGVGNLTGRDVDPRITLMYSNDGVTFKNARTQRIGRTGEYRQKVCWNILGSAVNRSFRITSSAECPIVIYGAKVRSSQGVKDA